MYKKLLKNDCQLKFGNYEIKMYLLGCGAL